MASANLAFAPQADATGLVAWPRAPRQHPSLRQAALLAAGVLAAHAWLLSANPPRVAPGAAGPAGALVTRTIELGTAALSPEPPKPAATALRPVGEAKKPSNQANVQVDKQLFAIDTVANTVVQGSKTESLPSALAATWPPAAVAQTPTPATPPDVASAAPAAPTPSHPEPARTSVPSAQGGRTAGAVPSAQSGPAIGPLKIPGSIALSYTGTGSNNGQPMQAGGKLIWRHDGVQYDARVEFGTLLFTARTLSSAGQITAEGLAPVRFGDKGRSAEQAAHFEREKGKISFSANKGDAALQAGAQDRLSVMLQLGAMFAGDASRYPVGSTVSLQTAGAADADVWRFVVDGPEKLALPAGEFTATKLTRNPRREFDDKVELWLAADLGYLPVRIRQTSSNGNFTDLQLRASGKP